MSGTAQTATSVIRLEGGDSMWTHHDLVLLRWLSVLTLVLWEFVLFRCELPAQGHEAKGKITFITPEFVYTSLGRSNHVEDSSNVNVIAKGDTIARLRVVASSSKSTACRLLSFRRAPAIGDTVVAFVAGEAVALSDSLATRIQDTVMVTPTSAINHRVIGQGSSLPSAWLTVQGRIALQYTTFIYSDQNYNQSEPGVSVSMKGKLNGTNFTFQISGNFRALIRNRDFIASAYSSNLTKVYRLSFDYSDGVNSLSLGRVVPGAAPLLGAVDGGYVTHTFGDITMGLSGGFEPAYVPGFSFTDLRKIAVFGEYQSPNRRLFDGTVVYSRSYFKTQLSREAMGGSLVINPTQSIFFTAQSEVDLRTVLDGDLTGKAKLTSLNASLNYAAIHELSIGVGVSVWRPTYFFGFIQTVPQEFLDTKLRTTPLFTLRLDAPGGLSASNSYSPRSSDDGFGKEYLNTSSIGWYDRSFTGINYRASYTVNTTLVSRIKGYALSAQRTITTRFNLNLRYQTNRYTLQNFSTTQDTRSLALDLLASLIPNVSLWLSTERNYGNVVRYTYFLAELSYHL